MRDVAASEEATPVAGAEAEPVGRLPRLEDAERVGPSIGLGELPPSKLRRGNKGVGFERL